MSAVTRFFGKVPSKSVRGLRVHTETIRKMDRDELIEELRALDVAVDEQDESAATAISTDDQLRDDLCAALEAAGDPDEARGDHLRDVGAHKDLGR